MQCQADDLDFELSFDSDVDADAHDLEEFEDVPNGTANLRGTCIPEAELEHQAGNASIATDFGAGSAGMDGIDEDEDFCIGLDLDEDW